MHEVLVNSLVSFFGKSVVRLTDCLDMTITVDWDVKPQAKQRKAQQMFSPNLSYAFLPMIASAIMQLMKGGLHNDIVCCQEMGIRFQPVKCNVVTEIKVH